MTGIASKSFDGCKKLKKITFGSNIEKIQSNAFKGIKNLKKINVPNKMKKKYTKLFVKKGLSGKVTVK